MHAPNDTAGERLRNFIARVERLEAEKAAIAADIREVYAEAKGTGFDTRTMRTLVRLRRMDAAERAEHEALLDIYKAALGMLAGTPLGDAAMKKLGQPPAPASADVPAAAPPAPNMPTPAPDAEALEAARQKGRDAAAAGQPVTDNPYVAGDPRRAAFDEGWCQHTGNDGMEIPAAWRRAAPRKTETSAPPSATPKKPKKPKNPPKPKAGG